MKHIKKLKLNLNNENINYLEALKIKNKITKALETLTYDEEFISYLLNNGIIKFSDNLHDEFEFEIIRCASRNGIQYPDARRRSESGYSGRHRHRRNPARERQRRAVWRKLVCLWQGQARRPAHQAQYKTSAQALEKEP